LGGPNGVRAYPVGEGLGDHGMLATLELRKTLASTRIGDFGVFGFVDAGQVTQFRNLGPADQLSGPNRYSLKGYGVGATLSSGETGSLRIVVGKKAGKNPNPTLSGTDNDGENKSARVWIFGNIQF
jgi:hemolysin activation/secretion protein